HFDDHVADFSEVYIEMAFFITSISSVGRFDQIFDVVSHSVYSHINWKHHRSSHRPGTSANYNDLAKSDPSCRTIFLTFSIRECARYIPWDNVHIFQSDSNASCMAFLHAESCSMSAMPCVSKTATALLPLMCIRENAQHRKESSCSHQPAITGRCR